MQAKLGSEIFGIVIAYSRHGKKTYVQDRVTENAKVVLDMLNSGANLYICGRASMAREVDRRIEEIAIEHKGMSNVDIKAWTDGIVTKDTKVSVNNGNLDTIFLVNNCSETIEANVYFRKANLSWNMEGKWTLPAKSKVEVGKTNFPQFYLYGKTLKSGIEWKGDIEVTYNKTRIPMINVDNFSDSHGDWVYFFDCK